MTARDDFVLRLEQMFPLRARPYHRALTNAIELAKWWGPRGFTAPNVDFDPQIGGSYRIAMQPPDGKLFHLSGDSWKSKRPPVWRTRFDGIHPIRTIERP